MDIYEYMQKTLNLQYISDLHYTKKDIVLKELKNMGSMFSEREIADFKEYAFA